MKKIIVSLMLLFILMFNSISFGADSSGCIGPYNYNTLYNNYDIIVNDFLNSKDFPFVNMCTKDATSDCMEASIFIIYLSHWSSDFHPITKCNKNNAIIIETDFEVKYINLPKNIERISNKDRYDKFMTFLPLAKVYYKTNNKYIERVENLYKNCKK